MATAIALLYQGNSNGKRALTFVKGQSGNPRGPAHGSRRRVSMLVEQLMRDDAKDVVRSIITAAKRGDMIAARIITDRLAPLPKGRFLHIDVPKIEQPRDALPMVAGVLDSMAKGELTPHEARDVAGVVEVYLKVLEMVGLASEVADLKATMAGLQAQSQAQQQPSDAAIPRRVAE